MRPASAAFLRTVRGSHRMLAEARIVEPGQTGLDPTGTVIPVLAGTVHLDASADVRSTLDLTTDGTRAWSSRPEGLLNPYGPELWVRRGVEYGNGDREWIPLGYHRIYSVEQDNAPDGPIRLEARDRMAGIKDARMLAPRQFGSGTHVDTFVSSLVLDVYPTAAITYDFSASTTTIGRTVVVEEDRYAALADLARSLGKVAYWDHTGTLQLVTAPDPTIPVEEVNVGKDGVLVSLSRSMSRDGVYNAVVAQGEAPDDKPPARGYARDMNPLSPTYWNGDYGHVPAYYRSPLITTPTQATSAAGAMLARVIGLPYSVDFSAVPNPALEPLDPVRIRYRDGSEIHVLETLDVPLTAADPLTATTRNLTGVTIDTGVLE